MTMNIDARTTTTVFKAKPFWNGFGVFTTYEHMLLLKEAVQGSVRELALEVKRLVEFEENLKEAVTFMKELQKESPLEKEIGENIDHINIDSNTHTFNPVDLQSEGLLEFLEDSKGMPKREMDTLLHRILALKQMSETLEEAINEGINSFDKETELDTVSQILHEEFSLEVVEERLDEVRKEPLSEEELEIVRNQSLSFARDLERKMYQPVYAMVFQAVKLE